MAGPVDTTPGAQGKRKRPQKEKTPVSQGSKRVKSEHEILNGDNVHADVQDTPVSAKQAKSTATTTTSALKTKSTNPQQVKKITIDSPTKADREAGALQNGHGDRPKRQRRQAKKERRQSVAAVTALLPEAPVGADSTGLWTVSRPTGGRFIPHDPIVSADDRYALLVRYAL